MDKYRNKEIVFGTQWFEKHQSKLLWLLNAPIIRVWFRWVMTIDKKCCPEKVTGIQTNSITWGDKYILKRKKVLLQKTTGFYTYDVFSRRLYLSFKPFWYLLHIIDWVAFDRYEAMAKLSFGFSTLTVYSEKDTSDTPTPTTKSEAIRTNSTADTWANCIAKGGATVGGGAGKNLVQFQAAGAGGKNTWTYLSRSVILFNTSALTSGATISAVVMSVVATSVYNDEVISPTINIFTSNPASNTGNDIADFQTVGTVAQCDTAIAIANWSAGYHDFTLNATGRGNVSKTGISKFGLREATYDATGTAPTWVQSKIWQFNGDLAEYNTTSNAPKLVITYTLPAGPANLKSLDTNLKANIKSIDTNLIANVKSYDTVV